MTANSTEINISVVLRMLDDMVSEGSDQMTNRIEGRAGCPMLPVDDTQMGIEFAEDFLRQKLEAFLP